MSRPSDKKRAKQRARRERLRLQKAGVRPKTRAEKALKKIDQTWLAACDQAEAEGMPGEIVYSMRKTGLLVTQEAIDNGEATAEEIKDWRAALAEYRAAHPEEQIVNERGERISNV